MKRVVPFSAFDSEDVEDLWAYMENYEEQTGGSVLAIPHNGNWSNGAMFGLKRANGQPFDAAYAQARAHWEPVYEATQIKGDGAWADDRPNCAPTPSVKGPCGGVACEAAGLSFRVGGEVGRPPERVGGTGTSPLTASGSWVKPRLSAASKISGIDGAVLPDVALFCSAPSTVIP